MQDRSNIITQLIIKDLKDTLNEAEQKELNNWINESKENKLLYERLTDPNILIRDLKIFRSLRSDLNERNF